MIPRRKLSIKSSDIRKMVTAIFFRKITSKKYSNLLKEKISTFLNSKHVLLTSSGRDAILLSLDAIGINDGDEILIPAYTLGELIPIIKKKSHKIRLVDVEEETYTISVNDLKNKISPRTKVIIVTHLLGTPCNIIEICALAKEHNIYVLEDCAHIFGAKVQDKFLGTWGDISIFSFESNKPLPAYGGGFISTDNGNLKKRIEGIIQPREDNQFPAMKKFIKTWIEELVIRSPFYGILNRVLFSKFFVKIFEKYYRKAHDKTRKQAVQFSEFQAQIALDRLLSYEFKNTSLNQRLDDFLSNLPTKFFTIQNRHRYGEPNFYNLVLRLRSNKLSLNELRKIFQKDGIDIGIYSEVMDDCSKLLNDKSNPNTKELYNTAFLLPFYDGLSDKKIKIIKQSVLRICDQL